MSKLNFSTFIDEPDYLIGNSGLIHQQIKQALMAEADETNALRNFVLQSSGVPQTITSSLYVDGEFTTSSAFSTAGFDVNGDGTVDFNAQVHFQPETILQEFVKDGYCDLVNDQTINGIKSFTEIKTSSVPVVNEDLTNKAYVDESISTLHDTIQTDLDTIDTDLLDLHNTKQPNIVTTDDFEIHTLTLNGDLIIDDAKIAKSKIIDLTTDLSTIYSGLTSLQNTKQNNITPFSNIEMNNLILNGDLTIADAKINKSKVIDLNSDLSTINSNITALQNDKQNNLTNNSINDNWLSNNIPRYDITNVFSAGLVCDELTVVNAVNISDASLNKSKILDLNSDLSTITGNISTLQSNKQDNLTNNSINDAWLSGNVALKNANQTFENDVTIGGVLYATNMTVTNLTTINQTSTEESITNLTVDDITINANLVLGSTSSLTLLDNSIAVSKVNNLTNILSGKASTSALSSGLATKQNVIQDGDLAISHVADLSTQLNDRVTYDVYTTGLGTKQNVIGDDDLAISHVYNLQTILDTKATSTELTNGLALKQNTVGVNDLQISYVSGLQSSLDSKATSAELTNGLALKQDVVTDGSLSISKVLNLQSSLDSKASTTQLTNGLALKQDVVTDGSLSISKTSGLQTALDTKATSTELTSGLNTKQNTIGAGDLLVSYVSGLQSELDAKATSTQLTDGLALKQDTIGAGDLSISYVSGLQTELDSKATSTELTSGLNSKQDTIGAGDLSISYVSGLQAELDAKATSTELTSGLNSKQNTIGANDLSISYVSGLQAELDAKALASDVSNSLALKQDVITTASITDNLLASTFLKPDTNLTISSGRTLTLSGSIIANGATISPSELSYLDNLTEPLPTTLASLQSQIDGISGSIDLSGYQTLISDTNKIQISNINGLSTALSGKQATLSNASYLDATSSVQTQIDTINSTISGLSGGGDLSGYQTLISDTNKIQISNVNGLSTALSGKQDALGNSSISDAMLVSSFVKPNTDFTSGSITLASGKTISGVSATTMSYLDATSSIQTQLNAKQATLTNGSVSDAMLASTFVKPSTAPTLTGSNFTGIPTSAIIGYSSGGSTTESISGTTALSATINTSIITGSTHSLALSSTLGMTKTIINNNPNAFSSILTAQSISGNNIIRALCYDSVLNRMYVGGTFTGINGISGLNMICYYDFATSAFLPLGTGVFSGTDVYDIKISGTKVFVTGAFTLINGVSNTVRIAYWDTSNSSWNAMGTGLSSGLGHKMLITGGDLFVTGTFALAGGVANTVKIARWNIAGSTWNALGTGITTGSTAYEMVMMGSNLWVCGNFTSAGGATNSAYLAYWNTSNSSWNGYGANQYSGTINTIKAISANTLVVCGTYLLYGGVYNPYSTSFNTSTNTVTRYGVGMPIPYSTYIDNDGVLWMLGNGNIGSPHAGDFDTYYSTASSGLVWFNTVTNNWVPIMGTANTFYAMEAVGTSGVYWCAGQFTALDNSYFSGFASLLIFTKPNVSTVTTSALVSNGFTNRTNFKFYYNGQSVMLTNADNSSWILTNNSFFGNTPNVWLY
jgi:hypothetical protein